MPIVLDFLLIGHSFRRTSATFLAAAGGDILTIKRHGGWRSSTVAESYVESSLSTKKRTEDLISSSIVETVAPEANPPKRNKFTPKTRMFSAPVNEQPLQLPTSQNLNDFIIAEYVNETECVSLSQSSVNVNVPGLPTNNHYVFNNCNVTFNTHN